MRPSHLFGSVAVLAMLETGGAWAAAGGNGNNGNGKGNGGPANGAPSPEVDATIALPCAGGVVAAATRDA